MLRARPAFTPAIAAAVSAALLAGAATTAEAQGRRDRLIVPGQRVGAIYGLSTPAQLRRVYGRNALVMRRINVGEGQTEPGAILRIGRARLQLIWRPGQRGVSSVWLYRGRGLQGWRTRRGLRIGMTVAQVQRLSGRPFSMAWQNDGHGCVDDWRGGRMSRQLVICFVSRRRLTQQQSQAVLQYRRPRSLHPVVRRNMRVGRIIVRLGNTRPRGSGARSTPGGRLTAAQALCRRFGQIRSQRRNRRPASITFVNRSGAQRSIMWLNFEGRPVNRGTLARGRRLTVQTTLATPWMVTDGPGNCLEIHQARSRRMVVVLRPDRRNFGRE